MAVVYAWEPERWPTCRLLGIAARLDERRINRRLTGLGLTKGSFEALESIAEHQPARVSDIAALLCVSQQSLGRVLQRLQSLDLLTKKRGNDGRCTNIELTPRGAHVLAAAEDLVQELTQPAADEDPDLRSLLAQRIGDLTAETPHAGRPLPPTGK